MIFWWHIENGPDNGAADAFSRKVEGEETTTLFIILVLLGTFSKKKLNNITKMKLRCRTFRYIVELDKGLNPRFFVKDGCLYYKSRLYKRSPSCFTYYSIAPLRTTLGWIKHYIEFEESFIGQA